MGILENIRSAGFDVALCGDRFTVCPASKLTPKLRGFLREHKTEILEALAAKDAKPDDVLFDDDRRHCRECVNLRGGYCVKQAFRPVDDIPRRCEDFTGYPNEIARIGDDAAFEMVAKTKPAITCKTCINFESYHDHGGGAGICNAGVMSPGVCWWSDTLHSCDEYQSSVSSQADLKPDLTPEHDADRISETEHNAQGRFFKYLVTRTDGTQFYSYSMPRMALQEVQDQYSYAVAIEPVTGEHYPND
jgi:hypothetical protein